MWPSRTWRARRCRSALAEARGGSAGRMPVTGDRFEEALALQVSDIVVRGRCGSCRGRAAVWALCARRGRSVSKAGEDVKRSVVR